MIGGSTPPSAGGDEYQSFELDNFSIYKPDQGLHPNELAPLHHLCAKSGNQDYLFDGILREGSMERYVERVPFKLLSIGNHCDTEHHTVGDQTWVQSSLVQRRGLDVWYQLGKPAPEYRHYHEQFLWLANFAKHFTDYLQRHDGVRLHHFRRQFYDEIMVLHQEHDAFRDWLDEYDDTDFRRVITANFEFLWKEAVDVERLNANQPLWNEVHSKDLRAVKAQKGPEERTVVTPFVYQCFKNMKWGEYLKVMKPSRKVFEARRAREEALSLTVDSREGGLLAPREESPEIEYVGHESKGEDSAGPPHDGRFISLSTFFDEHDLGHEAREKGERMRARAAMARENFLGCVIPRATRVPRDEFGNILVGRPRRISVGDVVGVDKDSKTVWKGSADLWYAYVQGVTTTGSGRNYLSVLWLYEPSDTTCSTMTYPIHNELFFSDNCNCGDDKLALEDVACRVSVAFFSTPGNSGAECFVRQKYRTQDAAFVTLQEGDFICVHRREHVESELEVAQNKAKLGSTLLYLSNRSPGRRILEPGEVVANGAMDGKYVLIRRLVRRHRDFPGEDASPPNELVYTDEIIPVRLEDLDRTCLVRFFTEQERQDRQIPPPYNRNGTGDAFYITCRQVANGSTRHLVPLTLPFPKTMVQGFDPRAPSARPVLNGMDLYCGGGNFGRGLEEGRAVHNKWAVDYDKDAIHTYHANLDDPAGTALYYGSVNNFLAQGLKGRFSEHVPAPGEVDFISAGSPCQGFSNANQKKSDPKSLRNSSLVASVAAYVDYYRPKYALLENVLSMAAKGPKNQEHNVFSQLLCSLVGMGYQVQQFNLDAWSFGSPQSRSRLFVSIAAPGLQLPPHPALSHSHPASKGDRGLGVASNGVAFGLRRFEATPFEYVTAHEGTCDLPWIGDGRTQTCIPHPDHRTSRFESDLKRVQISQIPVMPRGQSFMKAYKRGRLGRPQIDDFAWENRHKVTKISKSWRRVDPNGLMPTVVTNAQPSCSFTGTVLHWEQHRLLTVMEVRRAQGFPDHEVLVGHPRVQWKIVGNSVARTVALALGLSLREAWLAQAPPELDPAQVEVTDAQSGTPLSAHAAKPCILTSIRLSHRSISPG
ncbi:MAG: DNA methyltransferase Dim-2 [Thelocarpon impressellum]|nr:MAG: DNA methyltransferase Dim-2 [Thelocarpon impressellum]